MTIKIEDFQQPLAFKNNAGPHHQPFVSTMDLTNDSHDSGYESPLHTGPQSQRSSSSTPAAIGDLGKNARKLVDTINQLAKDGVEASGLPLPKLVVVGDQSSGKSSLIEAISEVKVPRASGTCTRCVLKINCENGPNASWKLALLRKYHFFPTKSRRVSLVSGSWEELREPEEVAKISLKYEEVEGALWRAQEAILRPSQDQAAILLGREEPHEQPDVAFSPNVIDLTVTGPTLQDLTLYDLPGIINHTADNEQDLPKLVQDLAKRYVTSQNAITVLAIPMGSDLETSTAASLVRRWKADKRCVGVLTKPDNLPAGDEPDQWLAVLRGSKFQLGHGYYVTKQPNSAELKERISHEQARDNERRFFGMKPWSSTFSAYQASFGTGALQTKLGLLLAEEIATYLPEIRTRIQAQLAQTRDELQHYPAPPPSPYGTLVHIIEKLKSNIDHLMRGDTPGEALHSNKLVRQWRQLTDELLSSLKKLQPLVVVNTGAEAGWQIQSQVITIDDDDEVEVDRNNMASTPGAGYKRAGSTISSSQESPTKCVKTDATPSATGSSSNTTDAIKFHLDDIRAKIAETITSGVPSDADPRAEDFLIGQSMQAWDVEVVKYLDEVYKIVKQHLLDVMHFHTNKWQSTPFPEAVYTAISDCFNATYSAHRDSCMQAVQAEKHKPYTCNGEILKFYREKQLTYLRQQREKARQRAYVNFKERSVGKQLSNGAERDKKGALVTIKDLGEDPRDAEIQVMSRIRGYYHLAAGTLADNIGKKSQWEIFEGFRQQVDGALVSGLGLDGNDTECVANARMLLTENPEREKKRQDLLTEEAKMTRALALLEGVVLS